MVERIAKDSALAREALRLAQSRGLERPGETSRPGPAQGIDFERALAGGIEHIDQELRAAEELPGDLLTGKVNDFHEIAVQLKSAELSFKFAMEIRNKLIDAYREIMRMSV